MIRKNTLGRNGPYVGCLGYGAMVLEGYYGASDADQAVETIRHALDAGLTMIDSADAYGNGHNELLVGRAVKGRRDDAFIATKFGIVFDEQETGAELPTGWGFSIKINGTAAYVRKALAGSLDRLGVDVIDLWYAHYVDPITPIEETVGAMADAVRAGKVRYLGLSNATADEVRRAHAVHPITAVQYEYSLWRREAETTLLPTLRELGIALVCWAPLGSGFLTGTVGALDKNDFRQNNPRALGSNHCCKLPLWIRREGKRRTDLLLLGYHATFGIIRIASRRKGVAMMPNRTAGTSPVVQCGRMKLCCNRCTSRVRCSASAFLA